jgi:hypothetical protein
MARIVDLDAHELHVSFSGLAALRARRRRIRVPRTAIRSVSTRPFDPRKRVSGRRYFLSYDDPAKTITVEVDRGATRYPYDVLVLGL